MSSRIIRCLTELLHWATPTCDVDITEAISEYLKGGRGMREKEDHEKANIPTKILKEGEGA